VTGILSSNARKPAFEDVMDELKALAKRPTKLSELDETNLSQVHAMNCLKEIFKSSPLGKRSEGHIAECLQIAADSLNSEM
jgi:endonuclease III